MRIEIIKAVESQSGDKTQIHCQFIALKIFNKIKIKVKNPKNAVIVFKTLKGYKKNYIENTQ